MNFIDFIIQQDKNLMIYLNNLGNESWDLFWLIITNKRSWIPLYLFLLYLLFKTYGAKKGWAIVLIVVVAITFTDQFTNLIKNTFERLRPCSDSSINGQLRILKQSVSYSFFSGHASTSFAITSLLFMILRNYYKYIGLLFIWPVLFAYSRVYIGMHFPADIIVGMIFGMVSGFVFYKIAMKILSRI